MSAPITASVEGVEGEYREYGPAGKVPGYITELEERITALQDR
jgi:hypothetical protein